MADRSQRTRSSGKPSKLSSPLFLPPSGPSSMIPIGVLDDVGLVFDDDVCIVLFNQGLDDFVKIVDVRHIKSGSEFVHDVNIAPVFQFGGDFFDSFCCADLAAFYSNFVRFIFTHSIPKIRSRFDQVV